jgi:hypothetical protein
MASMTQRNQLYQNPLQPAPSRRFLGSEAADRKGVQPPCLGRIDDPGFANARLGIEKKLQATFGNVRASRDDDYVVFQATKTSTQYARMMR